MRGEPHACFQMIPNLGRFTFCCCESFLNKAFFIFLFQWPSKSTVGPISGVPGPKDAMEVYFSGRSWIPEQGINRAEEKWAVIQCVCVFVNLQRVTISCIGQEAENCYKQLLVRGRKFMKIHQSDHYEQKKKLDDKPVEGTSGCFFLGSTNNSDWGFRGLAPGRRCSWGTSRAVGGCGDC